MDRRWWMPAENLHAASEALCEGEEWTAAVGCPRESQLMNLTGKPDVGNLQVRFEEGSGVTQEVRHSYST